MTILLLALAFQSDLENAVRVFEAACIQAKDQREVEHIALYEKGWSCLLCACVGCHTRSLVMLPCNIQFLDKLEIHLRFLITETSVYCDSFSK